LIDNFSNVDVSIIIPCKNEANNLKWTIDSLMMSQNSLKFEIIVVDDGSQDNCTEFLKDKQYKGRYKNIILVNRNNVGAAQARNEGAEIARGKYFFFCDAHIKVPDKWLDNLVNTLRYCNVDLVAPCIADLRNTAAVGYGQTWDNKLKVKWLLKKPTEGTKIPIAGGAALGITKTAFEKINGFDHIFKVWGKEDEELCLKAWLYGYKIVINPNVKVKHLFRKKHPYEVTQSNVIFNMLCMAYSHFNATRVNKSIRLAKMNGCFRVVNTQIEEAKELIMKQREKYFKERIEDDDYFFKKFNILF